MEASQNSDLDSPAKPVHRWIERFPHLVVRTGHSEAEPEPTVYLHTLAELLGHVDDEWVEHRYPLEVVVLRSHP